jgi:pimeloyl-ACP methyl ester carboxylesterase
MRYAPAHEQPARRVASLGALTGLLLVAACATPVSVKRVDARRVHAELTANVLSTGEASAASMQVVRRLELGGAWQKNPEATLAALHASLPDSRDPDRLFALAELSFLHAERRGKPSHFLAAAAYAYAFLFPRKGPDVGRLDPRLRLAADLYNRGLTAGLAAPDASEVVLTPRRLALPFGVLEIQADAAQFSWAGLRLVHFMAAAEFEVRGLRDRYRIRGIGAPLAASVAKADPDGQLPPQARWIPPRVKVPVTAFLRFQELPAALSGDRLVARLELYPSDAARSVRIEGREVPLEIEWSSSLAYALSNPEIWRFELRGFLFGDFRIGDDRGAGLYMLHPHRKGRIPVVLIHGTASSPGRWGEMVNELVSDPLVRSRYEFWFYMYNTGNPIAYSGGSLRQALSEAVAAIDPHESDPALRRMVVIGHSQGGLLTKLTAVDSQDAFWRNLSKVPIEDMDLSPETEELLRRSLFVKPLPFVERLVFIATPHGGSFLARRRVSAIAKRLTRAPIRLVGVVPELLERNPGAVAERRFARLPSSVDNMTPNDPFIVTLGELPLAKGVTAHSIIAVQGDGPLEERNDGVVAYRSAHIEGVASELVVDSYHSVQGHPLAIAEVRRILLEHLAAH